ncbi:hypothetical protein [Streptomyces liangshanensis]|uniref:hypothetical protein n=1 Tax=Streptomyces liangshanensis TaxID=2717324 RepID=UPI001AAF82F4|nr:hypothetical protein [Streptomyces liangshanensis]
MTLRTLLALPRMLRHGPAVGADLPPDTAVVLDPVHPDLRDALRAAAGGDHGPARDLLAGTRRGAEWERRGVFVPQLARNALHHRGWLDAWLAEAPEDPDAVLVKAELCVAQAWEIRTGSRAKDVSKDQFQAFFALLDDAVPVISTAAELNPTDPVPWQIALTHATGSQAPREVFAAYWAEATARAPHHYGCHRAALQYLCEKWHGSHEEMFDFAEQAAAEALPGSLLHALPLLAAVEYEVAADPTASTATADTALGAPRTRTAAPAFTPHGGPAPSGPSRVPPRARIHAATERALALSDAHAPGDPEAAGVRNHLALTLILAGRHAEALEQFRRIGTHATELPWAYFGDARQEFLDFRRGVRMEVAARIKFFATPVRAPGAPRTAGGDPDEPYRAGAGAATATDPASPSALSPAPSPALPGTPSLPDLPGLPGFPDLTGLPGLTASPALPDPPVLSASLAVVSAPPHRVAEAALLCGVPLRIAPAADGAMAYVELAANPTPGRRARLLGEEGLTAAADSFTTGERWPALVLHRTADRHGFTLLHRGRKVATHAWDEAAPVPDQATAAATAAALAKAYGITDPRPLAALLRGANAPADRQRSLVELLGLPPLPPAFGTRPEALTALPGAHVLASRGLLTGIKETLVSAAGGAAPRERPPRAAFPRPRGWWVLNVLGLCLFVSAAAYAWWSPDIGLLREINSTAAALWMTARVTRAWHQRRTRT